MRPELNPGFEAVYGTSRRSHPVTERECYYSHNETGDYRTPRAADPGNGVIYPPRDQAAHSGSFRFPTSVIGEMRLKADLSSTSHILAEAEVLKRRHHGHLPSSRSGRDHGKSNVNGGPGRRRWRRVGWRLLSAVLNGSGLKGWLRIYTSAGEKAAARRDAAGS